MSIVEHIRAELSLTNNEAARALCEEMLAASDNYQAGNLNREEFEFIVGEIAQVRAQQQLAADEVACRWIVAAASAILSAV